MFVVVIHTHTHTHTNSTHLSLVCMVSIMATILVLSSSGKEFNSCGSIFFFQSRFDVLVRCQSEEKDTQETRKGAPFFFSHPRLFSFFLFIYTVRKIFDREPGIHTCFHFPRWTLINIIITIVLKATSRRRIRRRWRSWRRNYWTVFSSFSLSWTLFFFSFFLSLRVFSFPFNNKTID